MDVGGRGFHCREGPVETLDPSDRDTTRRQVVSSRAEVGAESGPGTKDRPGG